jgi:hypothetical protein
MTTISTISTAANKMNINPRGAYSSSGIAINKKADL